ncbi:unnamed protein product [Caenorhabditis nigoni]
MSTLLLMTEQAATRHSMTFNPTKTASLNLPNDCTVHKSPCDSLTFQNNDEIRLKNNDFTISIRNDLLKIASFTQNQFQAPRFSPLIQRGFYELEIVTTRPTFDTPAEFCFNPAVGKDKCETCTVSNAHSITSIKH